jgi:uncharacterized protein (DUF2062 family)
MRLASHRLIVPLKRSQHPPEYSARGILVGIVWGLTPTVGVQMAAVFATWTLGRRLFGWNFNLIMALAWTWISNPLTTVPIYYLFYVTGQIMFGGWSDLAGYDVFATLFSQAFVPGTGMLDTVLQTARATVSIAVKDFGLTLLVGSLPYATIGGALGFWWGLRFVLRYRKARETRAARKHHRRLARAR